MTVEYVQSLSSLPLCHSILNSVLRSQTFQTHHQPHSGSQWEKVLLLFMTFANYSSCFLSLVSRLPQCMAYPIYFLHGETTHCPLLLILYYCCISSFTHTTNGYTHTLQKETCWTKISEVYCITGPIGKRRPTIIVHRHPLFVWLCSSMYI